MRRALSSRIEQLERAAPTPQPKVLVWDEHRTAKLLGGLRTIDYRTWRHVDLSLEQLLTLARDDNEAESAREFEIQILERDAKIDAETALTIRKNLHAHFCAGGGPGAAYGEHVYGEPLAPLPHAIGFDEPAALNAARLQCPHFDSLPLEGQLEYLEEDLLKSRQHAAASRQHAAAAALRAPRSKEALHAETLARLREQGPMVIERQITELKEKIAERDRSAMPSRKETSATA